MAEYRFITKLHNIKLDSKMNKGKKIDDLSRISNSYENFLELFNNVDFKSKIGELEFNAFQNSTYLYQKVTFEDKERIFDDESTRIHFLDYQLSKVQAFLNMLWLVKDNGITVENGFLHIKHEDNGNSISSNGLFVSPSNSLGEKEIVTFTKEEIDLAIKYYKTLDFTEVNERLNKGIEKLRTENPLLKKYNRLERALYFIQVARNESVLPIRIMHYCTILETLFSTDNREISHQVSERFARFLGENSEERKGLFKLVKTAYSVRSKAVHGQPVNQDLKTLKNISMDIDCSLRKFFIKVLNNNDIVEQFEQNNEQLQNYFLDLVMN